MTNRIVIKYDGKVSVSQHSFHLGDYSIEHLIHKALGLEEDDYKNINAEVEIMVARKPDHPRVYLDGNQCALGGDE